MSKSPVPVQIIAITGLGEIHTADDLAARLWAAASGQGLEIRDGDVLVVAQKIVSKAEGRLVDLGSVTPSPLALQLAEQWQRDPRHFEVILRESNRIVRMERGIMICETRHGFVCANAGVDHSNVPGEDSVCLLPLDPNASAARLREKLSELCGATPAVIVADTFGRPWREGATNVAIGLAGINPIADYRGRVDPYGYELRVTEIAVADELAGAAELVMGKLDQIPAVVVRGYAFQAGDFDAGRLVRDARLDLFR